MSTSNPPAPAPPAASITTAAEAPASYTPSGLARRAANVFRKVWGADENDAAPRATQVVSFGQLTDRLKRYMPATDIQKIKEAFRFSDAAHLGQFRKSGEPYITHPIAVAEILTEWKLDA
ncbi:MAG TPA: guanosine-3',5'-bis(diphosphate) 3'-pyrophosphohydrolase, partial [Burkholderiaceae bacterium]|nr:guanosine-3',5'-bis(diphosphate) 3'-pyrophosphohydrolase [Burkholderiaceae bacterium]